MNEISKNKNGDHEYFYSALLSYRDEAIKKTFVYWDNQLGQALEGLRQAHGGLSQAQAGQS